MGEAMSIKLEADSALERENSLRMSGPVCLKSCSPGNIIFQRNSSVAVATTACNLPSIKVMVK